MSAPATDLERSRKLLEEISFEFVSEVVGELAERSVCEKLPQLNLF